MEGVTCDMTSITAASYTAVHTLDVVTCKNLAWVSHASIADIEYRSSASVVRWTCGSRYKTVCNRYLPFSITFL